MSKLPFTDDLGRRPQLLPVGRSSRPLPGQLQDRGGNRGAHVEGPRSGPENGDVLGRRIRAAPDIRRVSES